MKHAKSMSTISEILIKINLFSLGIYWTLVLFGNAEVMSAVKCGNEARIIRQLKRKQNSVFAAWEGPASREPDTLSTVRTLLHFLP